MVIIIIFLKSFYRIRAGSFSYGRQRRYEILLGSGGHGQYESGWDSASRIGLQGFQTAVRPRSDYFTAGRIKASDIPV